MYRTICGFYTWRQQIGVYAWRQTCSDVKIWSTFINFFQILFLSVWSGINPCPILLPRRQFIPPASSRPPWHEPAFKHVLMEQFFRRDFTRMKWLFESKKIKKEGGPDPLWLVAHVNFDEVYWRVRRPCGNPPMSYLVLNLKIFFGRRHARRKATSVNTATKRHLQARGSSVYERNIFRLGLKLRLII